MPEDFDKCVRNKGKVRTVSGPNKEHGLKEGQYIHYCVINNESFRGEIKTKERKS